jgi:ribonuclease J
VTADAIDESYRPGDDELRFLPLGGAGEIGMNLSLYGHAGKWLMVDLGITFGDDTTPGIDVMMADPTFIRDRRQDLAGLVITHAHEDHIGAVAYLWPELRCPVYATPFAAAVLRSKAQDRGLHGRIPIREVPLSGRVQVGPFDVEFVSVTHSIPEANALVLRTKAGTLVHTGDWKLDAEPLVGPLTDEDRLAAVGREGVDVLVCDSTNALVEGAAGSEGTVRDTFVELFAKYPARIVVTCFATNVARIESVAHAAAANDRSVALVGRSLWRIHDAAKATGYLKDCPEFLTADDVSYLPRDKVVLICTGSQGEPRSALARISADDHPDVSLDRGDTVIFSSREIPGNERAIGRVQNGLTRIGCEIVTVHDAPVHVSGHPARDELVHMYQLLRPKAAVPVHGEERHLIAHAELARSCQVKDVVRAENGTMVRLLPGPAEVVGQVHHGRLALDGNRLVRMGGASLRNRVRMLHNGAAVATLVLNGQGRLVADPQIAAMGLFDGDPQAPDLLRDLSEQVRDAVERLPAGGRRDDDVVREAVRSAVRRSLNQSHGKKPVTDVHLVRV